MQQALLSKPSHNAGTTEHECKTLDLHPLGHGERPGRKDLFAATSCVAIQLTQSGRVLDIL